MSSEDAWFHAVMGTTPVPTGAGASFCAECDEHEGASEMRSRHGDPYLPVEDDHPHYEGPGYRRLPVNGMMKIYYFPLNEPRWVAADEAALMRDEDPVVSVVFGKKAWAMPWWVMKNHHVANLDLDGRRVLITFCEACTSAGAWDPYLDGKLHTFRLDAVYNGAISTIDLETKSAWTGFTARSYFGPHEGRQLRRLPIVQSTWAQWKREFPHTLVLDGAGERRDGHGARHYPGSTLDTNVITSALRPDHRLPSHVLVAGVEVGSRSRCYPFTELIARGHALHDSFAGLDIVIFSKPEICRALAFDRVLKGKKLTFRSDDGVSFDDEETGTRWNCMGQAVAGPLAGEQLEFVNSCVEKFSPWSSFHHGTEIFPACEPSAANVQARRDLQSHWENRWADPDYKPIWNTLAETAVLESAFNDGWFTPGMKILNVGCGRGEGSASLASKGCRVMGVDISDAVVKQAQELHHSVPGLRFLQMDVTAPCAAMGPFDAIVDFGCLHILRGNDLQSAYAANLLSWSRPGTRFLLIMHGKNSHSIEQRTSQARSLFAPYFDILSIEKIDMTPAEGGISIPGFAFRLERRAAA